MGFLKTDDMVFEIILSKKPPCVNFFRQRLDKNAFPRGGKAFGWFQAGWFSVTAPVR